MLQPGGKLVSVVPLYHFNYINKPLQMRLQTLLPENAKRRCLMGSVFLTKELKHVNSCLAAKNKIAWYAYNKHYRQIATSNAFLRIVL